MIDILSFKYYICTGDYFSESLFDAKKMQW